MANRSDTVMDLGGMTVKALRKIAADLDIPGRSKMPRAELVRQIGSRRTGKRDHVDAIVKSADASGLLIRSRRGRFAPVEVPLLDSESSPEKAYSEEHLFMVEPTAPPYLDRGRPIPDTYGDDRIVFMVRGPRSGYVYWELSGPLTERFRLAYGKEILNLTRWALRIHAIPKKQFRHISIDVNAYHTYIQLDPGYRYQVSLGFYDTDGSFVPVLTSTAEDTPRESISTVVDERRMIETGILLSMVGGIQSIKNLGSSSLLGVRFKQAHELHAREGEVS